MSDQYFRQLRNVELSTIYYIDTQVTANWSNIPVLKSRPNFDAVDPPLITVKALSVIPNLREIGSRLMENTYNIMVDIYATSDGQKLDLAQFIEDILVQDWIYYLHSQTSGNPRQLDRVANGKIKWQKFTQHSTIDFAEDVEKPDRFRYVLAFNARVSKNA